MFFFFLIMAVISIAVPDPIPFVDEIALLFLTILYGTIQAKQGQIESD